MRHSDFLGLALLTGLAVALMSGGVAFVASGLVNAWELTAIVSIGGVLLAAASPRPGPTAPRNTMVHGSARPAAEPEAQAAARGDNKLSPIHDASFPD